MTIEKTVKGNKAVLRIEGWLDTQTAPELGEALEGLEEGIKELTLDLKDLEFISSAGLRQIVVASKKMDGRLVIENVRPEVMDVFQMTGFAMRLNIK